jgi:hypothetical protein
MKRLTLLFSLLCLPPAAHAANPQPPCGQAAVPSFAPEGAFPANGIWLGNDLQREGWTPPRCLGWSGDSRLVAALAGTFRSTLSVDQLVERMTRVSAYPSIKYWSVSRQEWRPIATEASPAPAPAGALPGETYYTERGDTGRSTHLLHVVQRTPDRAVIVSQNTSAIRIGLITAFEPGALQLAVFLERAGPNLWHIYEISRVTTASLSLVTSSPGSYLNRLMAFQRYLAGTPTDAEPPLAKN